MASGSSPPFFWNGGPWWTFLVNVGLNNPKDFVCRRNVSHYSVRLLIVSPCGRGPERHTAKPSHLSTRVIHNVSSPPCHSPSLAIRWYLNAALRHRFLLRGLRQGSTWNLQDTLRVRRMCAWGFSDVSLVDYTLSPSPPQTRRCPFLSPKEHTPPNNLER